MLYAAPQTTLAAAPRASPFVAPQAVPAAQAQVRATLYAAAGNSQATLALKDVAVAKAAPVMVLPPALLHRNLNKLC